MQWLSRYLSFLPSIGTDKAWIIEVFLVVFAVLLFNFFLKRLLTRVHQRLIHTKNPLDDAIVDAMRRPVHILVWILGISFAAQITGYRTGAAIFNAVPPARDVGVIFCITWFLIRLVKRIETNIRERREGVTLDIDHTTLDALGKLIRASIIITSALVILQTLGYSISGVLAFGGIGGIAVGFAAKDLLANFFGGLMIYLDRPFAVGDWIRSPDRNIEGTVEQIGWRLTCIRTFDKRPLYVPNSTFTSIAVENPSRMTNRRIYETIGIRYDDATKMGQIIKDVKKMLMDHPEIDQSQTMIVNFNSFAPSSLDFFVYTFTKTTDWIYYHEVKQDVLLKILDIIDSHGAQVAFPTSTIHIPEGISLKTSSILPWQQELMKREGRDG